MRIGQGFDAHRYKAGTGFVLGGVRIPCEFSIVAHSDGDVLLHACCDALLGALGEGDIGRHFPDSDVRFKDCDSRLLLREIFAMVDRRSLTVVNLDATVIAQEPRLSSYMEAMRKNIASDLNVSSEVVNVKATTTEGMGFTGRKEGIAASAVVLLSAKP